MSEPTVDKPVAKVGPLVAHRDALAKALAEHRQEAVPATGSARCACGGWEGPFTMYMGAGAYSDHLADALLASGAVQTPAAYVAGLAEQIEGKRPWMLADDPGTLPGAYWSGLSDAASIVRAAALDPDQTAD